jgi:hypothetical protein
MKPFLVWLNTPWLGCTFCSIFPGLGDFLACTLLPNGKKKYRSGQCYQTECVNSWRMRVLPWVKKCRVLAGCTNFVQVSTLCRPPAGGYRVYIDRCINLDARGCDFRPILTAQYWRKMILSCYVWGTWKSDRLPNYFEIGDERKGLKDQWGFLTVPSKS